MALKRVFELISGFGKALSQFDFIIHILTSSLDAHKSSHKAAKRPRPSENLTPPLSLSPHPRPSSEPCQPKIKASLSNCSWDGKRRRGLPGHVLVPDLSSPKSMYRNWKPPMELAASTESDAIAKLSEAPVHDWNEIHLDHFTIYRQRSGDYEMEPLHHLNVKTGCKRLYFDGVLSVGLKKQYVKSIPFEILSIDGYGDTSPSISAVWIQTHHARAKNIWYRLGKPTAEYLRFYQPFYWVANFGKLFVDFLLEHDKVELKDFRRAFNEWLLNHYESDPEFQLWYRQYGRSDFRIVVSAYHEYLWKEATSVNDNLRNHFIWKEVDSKALRAVRPQRRAEAKTIVTPFIYECFRDTYFSSVLEARCSMNQKVITAHQSRKSLLGFSVDLVNPELSIAPPPNNTPKALISKGSVVSVLRDPVSKWKDQAELWFGKHSSCDFLSSRLCIKGTLMVLQLTCVPFAKMEPESIWKSVGCIDPQTQRCLTCGIPTRTSSSCPTTAIVAKTIFASRTLKALSP
jgi:hypothetical protein